VTAILGIDVPVDPGTHTIVAASPGHHEWKTEVVLSDEGKTVTVSVPELAEAGTVSNVVAPAERPSVVAAVVWPHKTSPSSAMSGLRKLSIGLAIGGVAGLAYGSAEGLHGNNLESQSNKNCPMITPCNGPGLQENIDARNAATQANIGFAVGGVLALGAVVTWFVGAPHASDRMTLVPTVEAHTTGVAFEGRF
jgi:hypothetical protein